LSSLPTPWDNLRLKQKPGNVTVERNFMMRFHLHTIRLYAIACFIVAIFGPLTAAEIIVGKGGENAPKDRGGTRRVVVRVLQNKAIAGYKRLDCF
jgi:hypothetical protein